MVHTALQQSNRNPRLWMLEGVAYAGEGRRKEALVSLRTALKISPDYLPALQQEAQLYYEADDLAAIPVLQHILRLRPGDPMSHAMLAVLEYRHGNCNAAAGNFEKAGALLDSQLPGLHAYATCLVRLKQLDKAAEIFQRAVTLQPDNSQERRLLASIQMMAHKPQEAIATLAPLLQTSSPDAATLELGSTAYEDAGDTAQAVNTLRQAILLEPQNVNLYLDFAQISFAHDSFQVGIDVVSDGISQLGASQQGVSQEPQAAQLYFARGVLNVQLAEYDQAEADFEKAYELDPNQSLSVAAQGLAAVQANDLDHALAMVQSKLVRKPNDPILLYLQADILAQKGSDPGTPEFETAMRSAKRAVALQPGLAAARAVLAKLYLQTGQNQAAADQSRKALEIDPKNQASLYRLIQALRKTGNTGQIPDLLKRLAQLREEATKEQRQRSRYKLVEGEAQP